METPVINFDPTPKQEETLFYLADQETREIVFGGSAGCAKSFLGCAWLIIKAIKYPGTRWLMGRAKLSDLKASTLATFFDIAGMWKLSHLYQYRPQDKLIQFTNGSQICLRDLFMYPSDPDFTSLGSTEFTGAFIDEGGDVTEKAKNIVNSRLRYKLREFCGLCGCPRGKTPLNGDKENRHWNCPGCKRNTNGLIPKTLITCNPSKNWLYTNFYKPSKDGTLPKSQAFITALPQDNPHLPKAYIENLQNLDEPSRQRLLLGNWEYDDSPNKLIDFDAICDLWKNKVHTRTENMFLTVDVAGDGKDKAVIMVWHEFVIKEIKSYDKITTPMLEDEMAKLCNYYGISRRNVVADKDGVGLGVVQHFRCRGFINNSRAIQPLEYKIDKEKKANYSNLKTQCYFMLAQKINDREISIEPASYKNELTEELEQVKEKDWDKDCVKKVIPKETIRENIGRSPDYSDAMMMRMYFELVGTEIEEDPDEVAAAWDAVPVV